MYKPIRIKLFVDNPRTKLLFSISGDRSIKSLSRTITRRLLYIYGKEYKITSLTTEDQYSFYERDRIHDTLDDKSIVFCKVREQDMGYKHCSSLQKHICLNEDIKTNDRAGYDNKKFTENTFFELKNNNFNNGKNDFLDKIQNKDSINTFPTNSDENKPNVNILDKPIEGLEKNGNFKLNIDDPKENKQNNIINVPQDNSKNKIYDKNNKSVTFEKKSDYTLKFDKDYNFLTKEQEALVEKAYKFLSSHKQKDGKCEEEHEKNSKLDKHNDSAKDDKASIVDKSKNDAPEIKISASKKETNTDTQKGTNISSISSIQTKEDKLRAKKERKNELARQRRLEKKIEKNHQPKIAENDLNQASLKENEKDSGNKINIDKDDVLPQNTQKLDHVLSQTSLENDLTKSVVTSQKSKKKRTKSDDDITPKLNKENKKVIDGKSIEIIGESKPYKKKKNNEEFF